MATNRNTDLDVDQNVVADVELAEKGPDFERRIGEPVSPRRAAPPEVADHDLLIERKDLGPDSTTFIAKGDPIPPELRELPRRAAREAPSPTSKR
jgi:hypothetical protein